MRRYFLRAYRVAAMTQKKKKKKRDVGFNVLKKKKPFRLFLILRKLKYIVD